MKSNFKQGVRKITSLLLAGVLTLSAIPESSLTTYASSVSEETTSTEVTVDSSSETIVVGDTDASDTTTVISNSSEDETTVTDDTTDVSSLETEEASSELSEDTQDEISTGYASIEVTSDSEDSETTDLSGIVYDVYSDDECTESVGFFALSYDGKAYVSLPDTKESDDETNDETAGLVDTVYYDSESLEADIHASIKYLELESGTIYYAQMNESLYDSDDTVDSKDVIYNDSLISFTVTSENVTTDTAYVIKISVETSGEATTESTNSSEDKESGDEDGDPEPESSSEETTEASEDVNDSTYGEAYGKAASRGEATETITEATTEDIIYVEAVSVSESLVSAEPVVIAAGTLGSLSGTTESSEESKSSETELNTATMTDGEESTVITDGTLTDTKDTEATETTEDEEDEEIADASDDLSEDVFVESEEITGTLTSNTATSTDAKSEILEVEAISYSISLLSSASLFANTDTTWSSVLEWIKNHYKDGQKGVYCNYMVTDIINNNTGFYDDDGTVSYGNCNHTRDELERLDYEYIGSDFSEVKNESDAHKRAAMIIADIGELDAEPGDILFFYESDGSLGHAGIYAGNNKVIDSAGYKTGIRDGVISGITSTNGVYSGGGRSIWNYIYYDDADSYASFGVAIYRWDTTKYGYLNLRKWSDQSANDKASNAYGVKDAVFTVYYEKKENGTSTDTPVATATIGGTNYRVSGTGTDETTDSTDNSKFSVSEWKILNSEYASIETTSTALIGEDGTASGKYLQKLKLVAGYYYIVETGVPSGFEAASTKNVTITNDTTKTITRKNTTAEASAYFMLKKYADAGTKNFSGITYYIYDSASDSANQVDSDLSPETDTSDQGKRGRSTSRFVLSYNGYVYMDENGYNIVFVNKAAKDAYEEEHSTRKFKWWKTMEGTSDYTNTYYIQESSSILKSSNSNGSLISSEHVGGIGSCAYWYVPDSSHSDYSSILSAINNRAGKGVLDATGYVQDKNYYWVKFVYTYDSESLSGSVTIKVENGSDGTAAVLEVEDDTGVGELRLIKTSSISPDYLDSNYYDLNNATYYVYDSNNKQVAYFQTELDSSGTQAIGIPTATSYGKELGVIAYPDKSNVTTEKNYLELPLGTYTIKELVPANNYDLNESEWTLTIEGNDNVVVETLKKDGSTIWNKTTSTNSVVIGNGKGNTTEGGTNEVNVTSNTNDDPPILGGLQLIKTANKGEQTSIDVSYLKGLKFYVYKTTGDGGSYSSSDLVDGMSNYSKEDAII